MIRDSDLRGKIVQYYEGAGGEFSRITSRRTGYGALTYELLPRKAEYTLDRPDAAGLAVLTRRVMTPELSRPITAERNFARFLRERNATMRANVEQLLNDLATANDR